MSTQARKLAKGLRAPGYGQQPKRHPWVSLANAATLFAGYAVVVSVQRIPVSRFATVERRGVGGSRCGVVGVIRRTTFPITGFRVRLGLGCGYDLRRAAVPLLGFLMPNHIAEAQYKAIARALRAAVEPNPRFTGVVPSTKGAL